MTRFFLRNNRRTKMHFRKTKRQSADVHIEQPIGVDKDGKPITIAEIIRDSVNLQDVAELRINLKKLYNYINEELEARERQIICKRYGLAHCSNHCTKVEKAMTQQEVANSLGISRSYVSRIEKRALAKLKERFINEDGE